MGMGSGGTIAPSHAAYSRLVVGHLRDLFGSVEARGSEPLSRSR